MPGFECFEEIEAWKNARVLAREVYKLTAEGPFARDFALKDQIRRAAVSVMANIAEGFDRGSDREFIRFLVYAKGSLNEVRSHIHIAHDVGLLDQAQFSHLQDLEDLTSRLLFGLIRYLKN